MRHLRWPGLFGQKFVFVKWGFADVGLSTAPFVALYAGQGRGAWVTRSVTLRRLLQRVRVPVVKRIRHAAVKPTMCIVKIQIVSDPAARRAHGLVGAHIHFLIT